MSVDPTAPLLPRDAVPLFAALGDSTRLSLLSRLQDGQPHAIVELTQGSGLTRQAVTKHLRVLERARLVISQREGRETRYVFDATGLNEARSYLEMASLQWDRAIDRLRLFVED
ncbi:MAG TPA: transcriptional regulator [Pseudohongiella sp.]|nr:transcriptional regulator [Pseudohongiella sp.]HBX38128.1 transcriptional regulator [Pseudohongiella sp.]|tara:strand:- start:3341 stop:3682 length:342 start_codon:yes stop_codon:yes gene_type:complete